MKEKYKKGAIFIIWLFLVSLWNFGIPGALPIYDVLVAVLLSFFSMYLHSLFS